MSRTPLPSSPTGRSGRRRTTCARHTSRTAQHTPGRADRLNQIVRGWSNYFRHPICEHTMRTRRHAKSTPDCSSRPCDTIASLVRPFLCVSVRCSGSGAVTARSGDIGRPAGAQSVGLPAVGLGAGTRGRSILSGLVASPRSRDWLLHSWPPRRRDCEPVPGRAARAISRSPTTGSQHAPLKPGAARPSGRVTHVAGDGKQMDRAGSRHRCPWP